MSRVRYDFDSELGCAALVTGIVGAIVGLIGAGMLDSSMSPLGFLLLAVGAILIAVCSGLASACKVSSLNDAKRKQLEQTFGQLQIRVRPKLRCPYCHDGVGGQTYECPACKAIYHQECLEEAHGCTTLGCVHQAKPRRVRL